MNESGAMDAVHVSWAKKKELTAQIIELSRELATNVYLEYRDFRGCSKEASYRETKDHLDNLFSSLSYQSTVEAWEKREV